MTIKPEIIVSAFVLLLYLCIIQAVVKLEAVQAKLLIMNTVHQEYGQKSFLVKSKQVLSFQWLSVPLYVVL